MQKMRTQERALPKSLSILALLAAAFLAAGGPGPAWGEEGDEQDLAKKLSNPIADLISVPFQFNYDHNIGPDDDGSRFTVNVQPVIPVTIAEGWNVISRTILPITSQDDIFPGAGSQFGLGDTTQSLFLSPTAPGPGGLIWGVGPVLVLPTATDDLLGTGKWSAGPTAVGLVQTGPWTVGALANHVWSFAGDDSRAAVNSTYLQPFVAYTTPDAWTFSLNTESTYNWEAEAWSVPINGQISKVVKIGKLPISLGAGVRYWAESPDSGPEGIGFRFVATILLPK